MARNKYCEDFREKIVRDYTNGMQQSAICIKYSLSKSVVSRIISKYRKTGTVKVIHSGERPKKLVYKLIEESPELPKMIHF